MPTSEDESFEKKNYIEEMLHYYFFEPTKNRRVNAWKKLRSKIDLVSWGGHEINFEGLKIYPDSFILRHYIVLSRDHAISKYYSSRTFSLDEIKKRGWHGARVSFTPDKLHFPDKTQLKIVREGVWDTSEIWTKHTFMEGGF